VRRALACLFAACALFGASIDKKIAESERKLAKTQQRIRGVHAELAKIAKEIEQLQKEIASLDKKIAAVDERVKRLSKEHELKLKALQEAKNSVERLTKRQELLQKELSKAIARSFSKSLLLSSLGRAQEEDILKEEILRSIKRREEERLAQLSKAYSQTSTDLARQRKALERLKAQIDDLIKERLRLKTLKKQKSVKVKALAKKKATYDRRLQRYAQQRETLETMLRKYKIIKAQQQRPKAQTNKLKVKNYGGYRFDRTVRYKGPKTIAPLKEFVITRRFGFYKDPIYNKEFPSENIELKPLRPGAKVRNVLNGRVELIQRTAHLKYIVVVKHDGGLYTIYANIDRISPLLKKGMRIKKGYILGKVDNKLTFEVTKDQYHINPLDLIRVP